MGFITTGLGWTEEHLNCTAGQVNRIISAHWQQSYRSNLLSICKELKAVACSLLIPYVSGLRFGIDSAGDHQLSGSSAAPAHRVRREILTVLLWTFLLASVVCYSHVQQSSDMFGILSLQRSCISTGLWSLVFQNKVTEQKWYCQMVGLLCHWGGFTWSGNIRVRPADDLGKPRGMRPISPLAQTRWFQLSSVSYFTHLPCQGILPGSHALPWILERGQNLNFEPHHLKG